jgi:hypothetical protein
MREPDAKMGCRWGPAVGAAPGRAGQHLKNRSLVAFAIPHFLSGPYLPAKLARVQWLQANQRLAPPFVRRSQPHAPLQTQALAGDCGAPVGSCLCRRLVQIAVSGRDQFGVGPA